MFYLTVLQVAAVWLAVEHARSAGPSPRSKRLVGILAAFSFPLYSASLLLGVAVQLAVCAAVLLGRVAADHDPEQAEAAAPQEVSGRR